MSYNLTALQSAMNVYDLAVYANTASENLLIGMVIFALFFVFIMLFRNQGMGISIAASGFICFILSLYLAYAKLLSFYVMTVFLIITALAVLFTYLKK